MARHGRWRWALLFRCDAMMRWPAARLNELIRDGLRSNATALFPIFCRVAPVTRRRWRPQSGIGVTGREPRLRGRPRLPVSASRTSLAVNVKCVSDVFKAH